MLNFYKYRRTIENSSKLEGIGIHSGKTVHINFFPADAGTGIVFFNKKYTQNIPALIDYVQDTSLAVTLGNSEWKVQTVEHLLAALSTLGITDIYIEIDNSEVPILDGSAYPFIELFQKIGIRELDKKTSPIVIKHPIWVVDEDKYLVVLPSDEQKISYTIDFSHPKINAQTKTISLEPAYLMDEILQARTFGFLSDVRKLQSKGLALGGGANNAIIFTEDDIINPDLRYKDECVRHKILDFIGDLSLLGRPIQGRFIASKGGHALDIALVSNIKKAVEADEFAPRRRDKAASLFRNIFAGSGQM